MNNLEQIMTILEESRPPLSQMIDLIEASEHNVGDVWQSDKNENYYYRREKNRTVRIPNPTPEEKKQAERQKVKDEASATKGGSEPAKTLPPKPTKENPDPLTALLTKTLPPVRREAEKSDKDLGYGKDDKENEQKRLNRQGLRQYAEYLQDHDEKAFRERVDQVSSKAEIVAKMAIAAREARTKRDVAAKVKELQDPDKLAEFYDNPPDDPLTSKVMDQLEVEFRKLNPTPEEAAAAAKAVNGKQPRLEQSSNGWSIFLPNGLRLRRNAEGLWLESAPGKNNWKRAPRENIERWNSLLRTLRSGKAGDGVDPRAFTESLVLKNRIANNYNYRLQRDAGVKRDTAKSTSNILSTIDLFTSGVMRRLGVGRSPIPWASIAYAVGSNYDNPRKLVETAAEMVVDNSDKILSFAEQEARKAEDQAEQERREKEEEEKYGKSLEPWQRAVAGATFYDEPEIGAAKTSHTQKKALRRLIRALEGVAGNKILEAISFLQTDTNLYQLLEASEKIDDNDDGDPHLLAKLLAEVDDHGDDPFFGLLVVQCYYLTRDLESAIDGAKFLYKQMENRRSGDEKEVKEAIEEVIDLIEEHHEEGEPFQGKSGRWFVMRNNRPVPFKRPSKNEPPSKNAATSGTNPVADTKKELAVVGKAEAEVAKKDLSRAPPKIPPELKSENARVYIVDSKIGGTVPKIGAVFHRSVAFCPGGIKPTKDGGLSPSCKSYGLQPGTATFHNEGKRVDAIAKPVKLPASKVANRIESFEKKYSVFFNNCQHAADLVTREGIEAAIALEISGLVDLLEGKAELYYLGEMELQPNG